MIIYKIRTDGDTYSGLQGFKISDMEQFSKFYDIPLALAWVSPKVRMLKSHKEGDFFGVDAGTVLGIKVKIKPLLTKYLKGTYEYLRIEMKSGEQFYAINVLNFVAILDECKSDIVRFSDGGILTVNKYAFHSPLPKLPSLFKLEQDKKGEMFATDEFKDAVEKHQLTGLIFEEVWRE